MFSDSFKDFNTVILTPAIELMLALSHICHLSQLYPEFWDLVYLIVTIVLLSRYQIQKNVIVISPVGVSL